jgi:hypothetical protein
VVKAPALGLVALLATGCVYHLRVESHPAGAVMTVGEDDVYVLPTDLYLKWKPFRGPRARFEAPGYRPLDLKLSRRHLHETDFVTDVVLNPQEAFGDEPRRVLEVRLVPEHGPAGTWTESDVSP